MKSKVHLTLQGIEEIKIIKNNIDNRRNSNGLLAPLGPKELRQTEATERTPRGSHRKWLKATDRRRSLGGGLKDQIIGNAT